MVQGMVLELDVEPAAVAFGDTVTVSARVTNATDSTVTLRTRSGCLFRPSVLYRGEAEVVFSPPRYCTGGPRMWLIAPDSTLEGRSQEFHTADHALPGPLPRGEYVVESGFLIEEPFEPPTLRHPFEIR